MWKCFLQEFDISSLDDPKDPQGDCIDYEERDSFKYESCYRVDRVQIGECVFCVKRKAVRNIAVPARAAPFASKGLTRTATSIMAEAAPIFARTFVSAMAWRVEVFIETFS